MYAKVFAQMYDGSLCTRGPWEALVTFQQLLVLADQEGAVDMTAEAIARRTTIPLAIIERGIQALLLPDVQSRTPTEDGKRIVPLSDGRDWGWLVVNYKHYRNLKREEDRREYHREYWHKRKSKSAQPTQQTQQNQPITKAEAKAEAEEEKTKERGQAPKPPISAKKPFADVELPKWIDREAWDGYVSMRKSIKRPLTAAAAKLAVRELGKLSEDGHDHAEVLRRSTLNGWTGLFPTPDGKHAGKQQSGPRGVGAMSDHGTATAINANAVMSKLFGEKASDAAE